MDRPFPLSLSVRIAEEFLSKERASIDLASLAALARRAGYSSLCMRASQIGVMSSVQKQEEAAALLKQHGLGVSMVTGDFAIVYNNELGPHSLRNILPYLELAKRLGAKLVRVAMKSLDDLVWAQRAADLAEESGLELVHQCHTLSLFETVDEIEKRLRKINRPNFGLIYEPANLELCGEDYGLATIERLAPWIKNVYLQNQILRSRFGRERAENDDDSQAESDESHAGGVTLDTWCRGRVTFDLIPIYDERGIDFRRVFSGLRQIDYRGSVTAHQSGFTHESVEQTAERTADYLASVM